MEENIYLRLRDILFEHSFETLYLEMQHRQGPDVWKGLSKNKRYDEYRGQCTNLKIDPFFAFRQESETECERVMFWTIKYRAHKIKNAVKYGWVGDSYKGGGGAVRGERVEFIIRRGQVHVGSTSQETSRTISPLINSIN